MAEGKTDWGALWRSGALPKFCFISLGVTFHAGAENMISTIMPAMVLDIGGVELNGWNFAIYETGSIIAGAAAGRLSTYWPVRSNIIAAALLFAIGSLIVAMAPSMTFALGGRLISGFGGGALISLSFVATQRYFPSAIWPQLLAVLSAIWGIAAFGGPLFGGIVSTAASWRWAFAIFAAAALLYAALCLPILRHEPEARSDRSKDGRFPALALTFLALGVSLIAAAGVETRNALAAAFIVTGMAAIGAFFLLDARNAASRLYPTNPFDPRTTVGAGLLMAAALAVSTCSFGFYGPLLLAALHDFSPVKIGLIIASESISWSILSILVATAPKHAENLIVRAGALMVTAGLAGFAWAIPNGSALAILFFALLQGGGFGIIWPFASRRIVEAARDGEREITASSFSTTQRLGYAVGAAFAGIIANANGFSGGFTREAAETATPVLFLGFLPLACLGCWAAFRLTSPALRRGGAR